MEKKKESLASVPSQITLNMSSTVTLAEKDIDGEYDPFAHRESTNQYSNFGALGHLLKGSLGSGILAMPMAFLNGGLIVGGIGTLIIGFVCTHCVMLLVRAAQTLCVRLRIPALDMSGTAEAAFASGPTALRPYASVARRFVTAALFSTYYFGLTAYIIFCAESVRQVVEQYAGKPDESETLMYKRVYIALMTVPLIPLAQILRLKTLIPCSMVANMCIVVGFSITLYYLFDEVHSPAERNWGTSLKGFPIFFATVLFAMEGIGTVMPVENTMRDPRRLLGWNGVLMQAMCIVVFLFATLGFLGYLRFGDLVEAGSITLNLPENEIPAQVVKLLLAVAILLTYPLQMYVAGGLVWDTMKPHIRTSWHRFANSALRVVLVIGTLIFALAVPNLGPVISLIGALFFSILGLFIPAVVDLSTFWVQDGGLCRTNVLLLLKDGLLVGACLLSAVTGTYSSVLDIIKTYAGDTATTMEAAVVS